MTSVMHEMQGQRRSRLTVNVLDEGTPMQRLAITAEYWVEEKGFEKVRGILSAEETKDIWWALSRPADVGCEGCSHYVPPSEDDGYGGKDTRMFCDAGGRRKVLSCPTPPACPRYDGPWVDTHIYPADDGVVRESEGEGERIT